MAKKKDKDETPVWIRYRCGNAWGHSEWEYGRYPAYYLDHPDFAEDFLETTEDRIRDHYRGYEWERIESPPREWLEGRIKGIENGIARNQQLLIEYQSILNERKETAS